MPDEKKIQKVWELYRKSLVPRRLSPKLVKELRQAFFGGAAAIFLLMQEIGDLDEVGMAAVLDALHAEVAEFAESIDVRYLGHGQQGGAH